MSTEVAERTRRQRGGTMKVVVAGAGNVGRHLSADLAERGHDVTLIELDPGVIERARNDVGERVTLILGDGCEPWVLEGAGCSQADVVVAATGDDEDNLVISLLAKQEHAVPRVVARVNHPDNEWLFTESWGVDVAVSTPHLLASLVEEAVSVGDLVRLLNLEQGKVALLEVTLAPTSPAAGKTVGDLKMPPDCTLVAVVRERHVIAPKPETPLQAGDEVLALASPAAEGDLKQALTGAA